MSYQGEMVEIEVPKSFKFWGTSSTKKVLMPKSNVQGIVNEEFEKKEKEIKKNTMRKIAEENLSYKPGSTLNNFDESLNGLGGITLQFTQIDLNIKNLKKEYTERMLNLQKIVPTNFRGFNINTNENDFRVVKVGTFLWQAAKKFKDMLFIEEESKIDDDELIKNFSISDVDDKSTGDSTSNEDNLSVGDESFTEPKKSKKNKKNKKNDLKSVQDDKINQKENKNLDKERFKKELFYFMKINPFLYFAIIDNVESYKLIQDFEKKYNIDGLLKEFKANKSKWFNENIHEELDEQEIMKFSNFYSAPTISDGNAKIDLNEKSFNFEYDTIKSKWEDPNYVKEKDESRMKDLKRYILDVSKEIKNESYFNGLTKEDLEKIAYDESEKIKRKHKESIYFEAFLDEEDLILFKDNPKEWAKEKVMYYSNKSFFGIPCSFICMMRENWLHGNHELLGGNHTRWLSF